MAHSQPGRKTEPHSSEAPTDLLPDLQPLPSPILPGRQLAILNSSLYHSELLSSFKDFSPLELLCNSLLVEQGPLAVRDPASSSLCPLAYLASSSQGASVDPHCPEPSPTKTTEGLECGSVDKLMHGTHTPRVLRWTGPRGQDYTPIRLMKHTFPQKCWIMVTLDRGPRRKEDLLTSVRVFFVSLYLVCRLV